MTTVYLLIKNKSEESAAINGVYICEDYCKQYLEELQNDEYGFSNEDSSFIQPFEIEEHFIKNALESHAMGFNVFFGFDCSGIVQNDHRSHYFTTISSVDKFIPNPTDEQELAPLIIEPEKVGLFKIPENNQEPVLIYVGVALWYEVYSSYLAIASHDKNLVEDYMSQWDASESRCGNSSDYNVQSIEITKSMLDKATDSIKLGLIIEIMCGIDEYDSNDNKNKNMIKNVLGFWTQSEYTYTPECRLILNKP